MSKTYVDDEGKEQIFTVFITHGRSELWREVERYIVKKLDFDTTVLKEQPRGGATIIEKLEDEARDCDCAVVIVTPDDKMADGTFRARQNVIHEIGYLQALLGREYVIILKEESVDWFSNNSGIEYFSFSGTNIQSTFHKVHEDLQEIYDEFCEDDDE